MSSRLDQEIDTALRRIAARTPKSASFNIQGLHSSLSDERERESSVSAGRNLDLPLRRLIADGQFS